MRGGGFSAMGFVMCNTSGTIFHIDRKSDKEINLEKKKRKEILNVAQSACVESTNRGVN